MITSPSIINYFYIVFMPLLSALSTECELYQQSNSKTLEIYLLLFSKINSTYKKLKPDFTYKLFTHHCSYVRKNSKMNDGNHQQRNAGDVKQKMKIKECFRQNLVLVIALFKVVRRLYITIP